MYVVFFLKGLNDFFPTVHVMEKEEANSDELRQIYNESPKHYLLGDALKKANELAKVKANDSRMPVQVHYRNVGGWSNIDVVYPD